MKGTSKTNCQGRIEFYVTLCYVLMTFCLQIVGTHWEILIVINGRQGRMEQIGQNESVVL